MALTARQQSLIDDLMLIEDPQERLGAVVDRARKSPALPEDARTEEHRVSGCQSQVWLILKKNGETCVFLSDSDSPLVRGLVQLTCDFFSGEPAAHILGQPDSDDPIALLDLARNLSPTRRNGLAAVRSRLRQLAATAAASAPSTSS